MNDTIEFSDHGEGGEQAPAVRIPITVRHSLTPPPEVEADDLTTLPDAGDADLLVA
ncbi:MAG: hypothetical protein AAGI70_04225 [Pseudomonadota bacterium]